MLRVNVLFESILCCARRLSKEEGRNAGKDKLKNMKNKKEQSVPSPRPVRAGPKGAESRYIPMESYLTKGKLSYIIPKKSKNSAVAFFDLGRKEPLVYDLKK